MKIVFSPIIVRSVLQVWTFFFFFKYWKVAYIRIGQQVHLFQIFEFASFLGACRELPLFVFCLSPLMFCCLRFEFLQIFDWQLRCLAVWCWVRGLVVSDVSKERCSLICNGQRVMSPLLLHAGSGIRSCPRKPELFSLLSVIQHDTLLFVNLHSV